MFGKESNIPPFQEDEGALNLTIGGPDSHFEDSNGGTRLSETPVQSTTDWLAKCASKGHNQPVYESRASHSAGAS